MHIGIDAKNLTGPLSGISRYVASMISHLSKHDIQITLFAPCEITNWSFTQDNVNLVQAKMQSRLQKLMWSTFMLPHQVSRAHDIDIFWGPAHRLSPFLPRRLPKIVTIHDLVWRQFPQTMPRLSYLGERFQMPGAIARAQAIISPSNATCNDVVAVYPAASARTVCIYPGITKPIDTVVENDQRYALFVGTQEPRKNLVRLVEAYAKLSKQERVACRLKIVGAKGWLLANLNELAIDNDAAADIDILGFVSDRDLEILYRGCDFLVMPSLGEGFGLPIIEAQKYGKPVLTSNTSAMPEVAGEGALFVDPLDVDSIALGLSKLVNDDQLRSELSLSAEENAKRFRWEAAAQQFLELAHKLHSKNELNA